MHKVSTTFLALTVCCIGSVASAAALHATCQLCEDIRERNRQNPSSGYTYYEDYVQAQGNANTADTDEHLAPAVQSTSPITRTAPPLPASTTAPTNTSTSSEK